MPSKRQINVKAAKPAKPAAPVTAPVSAAPAPVATVPAVAATTKPAKPAQAASAALLPVNDLIPAGVNRTAATIAKQATNFGGVLSERDNAYIAFYAGFALANSGAFTVADVARQFKATGHKPAYSGSAKPHDAGVCVRLCKAGILTMHDNGHRFTFTDAGRKLALYTQAKRVTLA